MKTSEGMKYSTPIPNTHEKGFSPIYRAYGFEKEIIQNFENPVKNLWEVFERAMDNCANNAFLGTRVKYEDGTFGPYVWKTYQQIRELTMEIASGMCYYNMANEEEFPECEFQQKFKFVGIHSKNREEWNITDYACCAMGYTLVPLYDTLGAPAIKLILNKTRMSVIVASGECVEKLLSLNEGFKYLKFIVAMDYSDTHEAAFKQLGIRYISWRELIDAGSRFPINFQEYTQPTLDSVNTISFTSGTTGEPKGAIITHKNFVSALASYENGILSSTGADLKASDVILSYLPMAHIYERIVEIAFACKGAKIGFYCGNVLKITDDLDELCPTVFVSVPRLYLRMNDKIMSTVHTKSNLIQKLFQYALNSKINKLEGGGKPKHWLYDMVFFSKSNKILGGNVRLMISGGAPLSKQMQEKMSTIFCVPLSQGYGLTETMGGSFLAHQHDMEYGHIGGPNSALEFRLRSVPEMNYNAESDTPQGELLLRGPSIAQGYFLNEEATKEMYDDEGWFRTGDIVTVSPNGSLKVIDRSKNIFKLSQGEYVIPEKIEDIIAQSSAVDQVFLFGYSEELFPVAIVVANSEYYTKWAKKNDQTKSFEEGCNDPEFNKDVYNSVVASCKANNLAGFEIPKAIYLTSVQFSIENDLLTPSFKIKRLNCKMAFKKEIDELYVQVRKNY